MNRMLLLNGILSLLWIAAGVTVLAIVYLGLAAGIGVGLIAFGLAGIIAVREVSDNGPVPTE